jgi:hypothetical protein
MWELPQSWIGPCRISGNYLAVYNERRRRTRGRYHCLVAAEAFQSEHAIVTNESELLLSGSPLGRGG